jgi:hypothetical protein
MTLTLVQTHENGPRHPWLDTFCTHLQNLLIARSVPNLTELPHELIGIAILPMWVFLEPTINVGRKAANGLIPARLEWRDAGARSWSDPLVLADVSYGSDRVLEWRATGLGYGTSIPEVPTGRTTIECTDTTSQSGWDIEAGVWLPTKVTISAKSPMNTQDELRELRAHGEESRWAITDMLQRPAERAVEKACNRVSWEVSGFDHIHPVIDEEGRTQAVNELLYGREGTPTSHVIRLIDRCLLPSTFLRVEPHHYVRESLRRDATGIVRHMIGDPHIGPKVRRVLREDSPTDLDELIRIYRERYPNDQLSTERAAKAITAGHDVMSTHLPTDPTGERLLLPKEER